LGLIELARSSPTRGSNPVIRILLENNVPLRLVPLLRRYWAAHASLVEWARLTDGELLRAVDEVGLHPRNVAELVVAVEAIQPGAYVTASFPRLRRRRYPRPEF
jgi:hypothetical protein